MNIELNDNFRGRCLVAMPSTKDDIFHQSVIYITEHNTIGGAIGVIINKNLTDTHKELTPLGLHDYPSQWQNVPLYLGGPVELTSGFVLHEVAESNNLMLTGNRKKIQQLADDEQVKPLILTAGYCIWETLQLEREVRFNNWLVLDDVANYLLNKVEPSKRYDVALKLAGIDNLATFDFRGAGNA